MLKETFGKKLGMTQLFDADGVLMSVSLIEVEPVCVLEQVSSSKKAKVKIGCFKTEERNLHRINKPQRDYFKKIGTAVYKMIKEVEVENGQTIELKKEVGIEIFSEGSLIDVRAKSKGKGFQGGMKRYGWRGQPRAHGSTTHRRIGSAGATTFPGRIIKGLHMPGHMGDDYVTVKNLTVVKVDKEKNVLFLKGAVPGAPQGTVLLRKVTK